jgi:hypothetical protein
MNLEVKVYLFEVGSFSCSEIGRKYGFSLMFFSILNNSGKIQSAFCMMEDH